MQRLLKVATGRTLRVDAVTHASISPVMATVNHRYYHRDRCHCRHRVRHRHRPFIGMMTNQTIFFPYFSHTIRRDM